MNAKDTLQKIAEALNIASSEPEVKEEVTPQEEPVQEKQETPEQEPETITEEPKEETPEVTEEPTEEPKEAEEQPVEEPKAEEPKDDPRVADLEKQLSELREILKNAMSEPVEAPEPEKVEEPKGLTHSPEKPVSKKAGGIGNKGGHFVIKNKR